MNEPARKKRPGPGSELRMVEHGVEMGDGRGVRSVPRGEPTRGEMEDMMRGLPPIMKGMPELHYWTGLGLDFIRDHSTGAMGAVPMLPNFFADGKRMYPTGLVMQWLYRWFPGDGAVQNRRGGRRAVKMVEDRKGNVRPVFSEAEDRAAEEGGAMGVPAGLGEKSETGEVERLAESKGGQEL